MHELDIQRIKAVLLYILNKMPESSRDVYHIVKAAYYAQQYHFARYASRIYVDDIKALQFGPVPSLIYNVLKVARGDSQPYKFCDDRLLARLSASIECRNEWFYATDEPDMDHLSKSNVECLDDAIKHVSKMGFGEIKNKTHGREWSRAFHNDGDHKMDDIAIAKEGGADEGILYYLAETLENEKLFE